MSQSIRDQSLNHFMLLVIIHAPPNPPNSSKMSRIIRVMLHSLPMTFKLMLSIKHSTSQSKNITNFPFPNPRKCNFFCLPPTITSTLYRIGKNAKSNPKKFYQASKHDGSQVMVLKTSHITPAHSFSAPLGMWWSVAYLTPRIESNEGREEEVE